MPAARRAPGRGSSASWNPEKAREIQQLAVEAQWFEDRMPWDKEFKKPNVKGINARAITVIMETGDSGPMTPIGINLPNEADIRQDYGSKSVNLANVVEAYDKVRGRAGAYVSSPGTATRSPARRSTGPRATDVHDQPPRGGGPRLRQVRAGDQEPGAASSAPTTRPWKRPAPTSSPSTGSRREACRRWGSSHNPRPALAEYEGYCRNILVQLRRVPKGGNRWKRTTCATAR